MEMSVVALCRGFEMFKRISELFKSKKAEPQKDEISREDLPGWLTTQEESCARKRSEQINESRATIDNARTDILNLLKDFGAEDTTEPLHPKVEQVNRLNLPQFIRKIESALDVTFSEDDEIYYGQVAEMINGCFKAYKGPGRYLHHVYGTEVKLFRQSMDQIGRELNILTEIIKVSRIRIGRVVAIRQSLEQLEKVEEEMKAVSRTRDDLAGKKEVFLRQQGELSGEKETVVSSPEYLEYLGEKEAHEGEAAKVTSLFEDLDALIRTALPIWRRALRIVQDEHNREKEKALDNLIQMATLQKFGEEEFSSLTRNSADMIFPYIADGQITLKNSFEKSLFVSADEYQEEIARVIHSWQQAETDWRRDRDCLVTHPACRELVALEHRIEDLEREVRHIDEEIVRVDGRMHHLQREKDESSSVIVEEMNELSGGKLQVAGFVVSEASP